MPFFIAWDVPSELHPGRARAEHRIRPSGIVRAEISGDPAMLRAWLGGAELPLILNHDDAPPGVRSVTVGLADGGELTI